MVSMPSVRRGLVLALLLGASVAAGCGGGASSSPTVTQRAARPAPPSQGVDPRVLPPRSVPTKPTGHADPDAIRTIQAWAKDVRHGRFLAAARLFALPSRFQNGTPVLTLRSRLDVLAAFSGFTCGAVVTRFGAAGRFTVVRFRLTSRTGGDCAGAVGATTGGAIEVVGGRIRAWYRLYDPEEILPQAPAAVPDPNDTKA